MRALGERTGGEIMAAMTVSVVVDQDETGTVSSWQSEDEEHSMLDWCTDDG